MAFLPRFVVALLALLSFTSAISIKATRKYDIAADVEGSVHMNGLAFQQSALTTFGDYQYVAFYKTASGYGKHHVNLGRRRIAPSPGDWRVFAFTDYVQQTLDEHNTISIGISGDGKIHLSFDHHDVPLNYRVSTSGIAKTVPSDWTMATFGGSVQHSLPGSTGPWTPLTYPRFERLANGDLLMEFRIGQSGAGDSYIHRYSSTSGQWSATGKYLQGQNNNAYINGLTSVNGKLFASWTVRETPDAATNHDFYFAVSEDDGRTWKTTTGASAATPITPSTAGIKVYTIAQNMEIMNQEAQAADDKGRFHALMRDKTSGTSRFYHYLRTSNGAFTKTAINAPGLAPVPYLAYRGKLAAKGDSLIAILPDKTKSTTVLYGATAGGNYQDWKLLHTIENIEGEPQVDEELLAQKDILSLFVRQGGPFGTRQVQVWDFDLQL
ncbi:hypothetical protein CC80DRAFT_487938 [Byssothecium circinans]|uniref:Neuraminidase n=1 Tax=Byssothecium circinans TaxID=147558 RepID=A0A6A5UC78_9PLEO|nr:hypothetical protein CC80DRAFT_487938 [Byssothecium circinans]